ncbi:hypothetical protein GCM10027030_01230 [Luteococcus sediminum]
MRRSRAVAAATVTTVAVAGVGLAVADPLGLRDRPAPSAADVLPEGVASFVEVDLEPELAQQIQMADFARHVPGLASRLPGMAGGDVKQHLATAIVRQAGCRDVDYARQLEPWLGERVALAQLDDQTRVLAVQATDEPAARRGLPALLSCAGWSSGQVLYSDGYLVASNTAGGAGEALSMATRGVLSSNASYESDTRRLGPRGVVTAWAWGGLAAEALQRTDASSGAATLRFADGALEAKVVARSRQDLPTSTSHPKVADLPADTSVAVGISDGAKRADWLWESLERLGVRGDLQRAATERGLDLPQDLDLLLGKDSRYAQAPGGAGESLTVTGDREGLQRLVSGGQLDKDGIAVHADKDDTILTADTDRAHELSDPDVTLEEYGDFRAAVARPDHSQLTFFVDRDGIERLLLPRLGAQQRAEFVDVKAVGLNTHVEDDDYQVAVGRVVVG